VPDPNLDSEHPEGASIGRGPFEPGLAPERTDLAWNRSGLAVVACVAVLLRRIWPIHGADEVVALVCIAVGAGVWALVLVVGRATLGPGRRTEQLRREQLGGEQLGGERLGGERLGGEGLSRRRAAAMTGGTLALAVAAFVLAFFAPS
jgi:hypothetical protein